jgi:endonuclease YncB( thermonuclease family)
VPRPRASLLEPIEQEGISWEGQVLVVGNDGDIPAMLYVTSNRFLLTNRETILLEAPRAWLVPAPLRVQESDVRISITPEGVVPGRGTTERLLLTVREGRGPASQLVAILTGRARKEQINAEFPTWNDGVGAGRSSALPPLPAFEASQDAPAPKESAGADSETRGAAPIEPWGGRQERRPGSAFQAPEPEPVEPQSHAARFLSNRASAPEPAPEPEQKPRRPQPENVTSITEERRKRRAGVGIWTTRIAMVVIVALVAGWFARPYLPDDVTERLPAAIVDENGGDGEVALTTTGDTGSTISDGTSGAGTSPQELMPTAAALGVGGATSEIPDPKDGGDPSGPDGVLPTPTAADTSELPGADSSVEQPSGDAAVTEPTDTSSQNEAPADQQGSGEQPADQQQEVPAEPTQAPATGNETGDTTAPEPTQPPVVEPTEVPPTPTEAPEIVVPTEAPEIVVPTETPVVETPAPTEEPTEAPVIETIAPTEIPVTPTAEPTLEPTEIPVTETVAPTEEPVIGTPEPTTAPEATQAPETPAPTEAPTLEPQAPSVTEEQPATQQFVDEGIRYSVEGASTGSSVPELPQIAEISYGDWIVLAIEGQNWTDSEQVFDMREFALIADGEEIQVDVGNSWVASMLGYTPAYGNTDAILWAPGEEHQFALTFLAPRDAKSLVLKAGDQEFDLSTILTETPSLADMRQADAPDTIEAQVVDVVDGETIVVEKDGVQQPVRYLGIDAPAEGECYAAEAADANRALVEGKSVKIERQATDTDAQGNWVRDVWVAQDDGKYVLVAHQLVQEGAVTADISEPNTRFASWLRGAESIAKAEGRGLWGSCQQGRSDTPVTSLVHGVGPIRQIEV